MLGKPVQYGVVLLTLLSLTACGSSKPLLMQQSVQPPAVCLQDVNPVPEPHADLAEFILDVIQEYTALGVRSAQCKASLLEAIRGNP